ncbi:(deoxy)nucleoside triphosphate pyrophosphohydrolase [Luteolibacter sp. SL250]|uniref:(deoxy)nucleoside triphosphate pyrophosphohydrolase n=1 Tax=Luteolibacter sp. SL250 TaxID=2995170 RepID=UPI00226FB181|nr:(deoxy)nucleoside triphosphate pyrophosphohydrolase [Luteolibacter sp. SL250]WAC19192.1 (deoxy)nucleoside triphosphate pyrophosphohydrolase [Luteolibacter sp. SL250]
MDGTGESRREIQVVCGVIVDGEGRCLMCRRPDGKHLGGLWEFPGGKVDEGEMPDVALVRELEEELGIRVGVGERLGDVRWDYGSVVVRLMPFFCKTLSGNPLPLEHSEVRWGTLAEARELEWAPADVPILEELALREFAT